MGEHGPHTLLFVCACCEREVRDYPTGRSGRDRAIPPVCRYCERTAWRSKVMAGAFMDRRIAMQIGALAESLCAEANWRRYGHGPA